MLYTPTLKEFILIWLQRYARNSEIFKKSTDEEMWEEWRGQRRGGDGKTKEIQHKHQVKLRGSKGQFNSI